MARGGEFRRDADYPADAPRCACGRPLGHRGTHAARPQLPIATTRRPPRTKGGVFADALTEEVQRLLREIERDTLAEREIVARLAASRAALAALRAAEDVYSRPQIAAPTASPEPAGQAARDADAPAALVAEADTDEVAPERPAEPAPAPRVPPAPPPRPPSPPPAPAPAPAAPPTRRAIERTPAGPVRVPFENVRQWAGERGIAFTTWRDLDAVNAKRTGLGLQPFRSPFDVAAAPRETV